MEFDIEGLQPISKKAGEAPTQTLPIIVEPSAQERGVSKGVESLIEAYEKYKDFKHNFQILEKGNGDDIEGLSPPWDKICEETSMNKRKIARVIKLTDISEDSGEFAQALYSAKDKFDQTPPKGNIRVFQRGSCIVIVVDNNEDLLKAANITKDDGETFVDRGVFKKSNYRFRKNGQQTLIDQVPTIIVFDDGQNDIEKIIQHEENHYRFDLYLDQTQPKRKLRTLNETISVKQTIERFERDEIKGEALLVQLRSFAQQNKAKAIEELVCDVLAKKRMDWRDSYVDDYFRAIQPINRDVETKTTPLINQVKAEFRREMQTIRERIASAISSFQRLEKDSDLVYGTTSMRLLMADVKTLEEVLDSLSIFKKIGLGQEAVNNLQDLRELRDKPIAGLTRVDQGVLAEIDQRIKELLALHADIAKKYDAFHNSGYKKARDGDEDFPTSLRTAVNNYTGYLREASEVMRKKNELSVQLQDFQRTSV